MGFFSLLFLVLSNLNLTGCYGQSAGCGILLVEPHKIGLDLLIQLAQIPASG